MQYPYINYIKALLIRGYRSEAIADRLRAFRFAPPEDLEIDQIGDELLSNFSVDQLQHIQPGPNYNLNKFLEVSESTLKKLGIPEIIPRLKGQKSPAWDEALLIMSDADIRVIVMCMSVQGCNVDEILKTIDDRTGLVISPEGLLYFFKYFWNIANMTKLELFHFLSTGITSKHKGLILKAFHKRDGEVKWKIGRQSATSFENILTTIMNEAFIKFQNEIDSDNVDNINKVQQWANLAMRAAEKLQENASDSSEDILATLELKLKHTAQDDIKTQDEQDIDVI